MVFAQNRGYVTLGKRQLQALRTTAWTQDDSTEGGGRERPEHVLEVRLQEVIGRVEPGAETERMSGTHSRGRTASGTAVESRAWTPIGT